MAEQRPYRVPGSAVEARLGQVKCLAVLSFGCAFIAINWVTTQHAATILQDAPWLGAPLFRLPRLGPVYVPWSWVVWWAHWHDALALQPLWTLCTHESLYPTAVVAALATGAIGLLCPHASSFAARLQLLVIDDAIEPPDTSPARVVLRLPTPETGKGAAQPLRSLSCSRTRSKPLSISR